jgi:hypothetical protein
MTNLTTTTSNITYTAGSTAGMATGGCPGHNGATCTCYASTIYPNTSSFIQCQNCGQWYDPSPYAITHFCLYPTLTTTTGTTYPITGRFWNSPSIFKEVKELTTDEELIFIVVDNFTMNNLKLPAKFSDCFLKVGTTWSPLYPLIFSALENDNKEISFHLVTEISDKVFEGDNVILKSVSTSKIEDNLTLLQLCERTKAYFKKDENVTPNPAV